MASHTETAHRWAQGVFLDFEARGVPASEDRNGNRWPRPLKSFNMIADGPSIYSYGSHFEIARIVESPGAGRVVLFTTRSYSVSTSKHMGYVRYAIPSSVQVFRVDDFYATPQQVLESYVKRAIVAHTKASRARTYVQSHLDDAERELAEAEAYAAAFRVDFQRPALSDLTARAAEAAARERAAAKADREAAEARRALQRVTDATGFAEWQAGVLGSRCPYSYARTETDGAYLRRSPDGENLETSQGASVPWEHALKAFRFVKLVRERGTPWNRNGKQVRVGHYQLDRVDADGSFTAGCHRIEWPEIEALAKREGVLDAMPSADALTVTGAA